MSLSFEATYEALHDGVVANTEACEVVRVVGPDALTYLQGQCSQDLDTLVGKTGAWTLVLSPQGRIDALSQVVVASETECYLVVGLGEAAPLEERLRRFKLRVKADIDTTTWRRVRVRGPEATSPANGAWVAPALGAQVGFDLLGADVDAGAVALGDDGAFETYRIEAGAPLMGREITEKTIPPEAGIVSQTVSFTKGCFTGQELVARLDTRGNNVPRHLRAIVAGEEISTGDVVVVGDQEVGELTSVAYSPARKEHVALGYVRRAVSAPTEALVRHGESEIACSIEVLPLGTNEG